MRNIKPLSIDGFSITLNDKEIALFYKAMANDAIKFLEWVTINHWSRISKHDGVVYWCKPDNYHYTYTTQELYKEYQDERN